MIGVSVKVKGMEQVQERLTQLGKGAIKLVKKALRAGAKVSQPAAVALAPHKSGATKRNIKVRAGRGGKDYAAILVGIGKKWYTGDQFYAAFIEFGHKAGPRSGVMKRKLKNGVIQTLKYGNRKQIPGEHFIEYAFEESHDAAISKIIEVTRQLVDQMVTGKGGEA